MAVTIMPVTRPNFLSSLAPGFSIVKLRCFIANPARIHVSTIHPVRMRVDQISPVSHSP